MTVRSMLAAVGIAALAIASTGAEAQQSDKPPLADFTPFVPPLFPLPPATQVTPGAVGGSQNPYTTAPLKNQTLNQPEAAPGIRLTIPSR